VAICRICAEGGVHEHSHGLNGYIRHRCRCLICTKANAERMQRYRARYRGRDPGEFTHGHTGYSNFACKCPDCMTPTRAFWKRQRARKRLN
jgi:hypothetical protein